MSRDSRLELRLCDGTQQLGLTLHKESIAQLLGVIDLLIHWNRAYNLTSVRDPLDMIAYHLLDSLALTPYLYGNTVLDIGTGAGFPGLPLAIIHPERAFTLLDSNGKKTRFVRQVILELGIKNVKVVQSRIESYKASQAFTTITARALAALPLLLQWSIPLLARPGVLLAPKGPQETEPLLLVGGENIHTRIGSEKIRLHRLNIPYVIGQRTLIELRSAPHIAKPP
jgi:16S rRNA (guanine527-N7)-methyltransferase